MSEDRSFDELLDGQDVAVCPSCAERNLARARFCMMCGARMKVESGERRIVSVLFADLSGFTSYSERVDPEAVRALADEAARGLGHIVEQYGGTVDKIIGDCVMAIFGAPVSHEDDAERAVRAALDMQRYAGENAERFANLKLTIGVHTGEAIYAPVGPSGAYTVLGDTVNTAARLQGAADRGEVLIGDPTLRSSADALEVEEIPPIVAKNKANPVIAWRAVGIKGERRRRVAKRTPLVGRTLELNRLLEQWERARTEHRPQLTTVLGSPGMGKTRLVEAFVDRVAQSATVHRGRCLSYGEGITYWPLIEIIREASGIRHDDTPEVVSKKLGTLLENLGIDDLDELRTMAVALANIADAPTTPRGTYKAEKISRAELHWGLRRIFELLSRQRPVVIVLEDLHWAEPTLLDLMGFFLEADESSIMLIGTGRPELAEEQPGFVAQDGRRRAITLGPLSDEHSEELLVELVGEAGRESMRSLLRSAGGNPLFLEEIIRMLNDFGAIDAQGLPTIDVEAVPVPGNLHALIGARLDRLGATERTVAGWASVIGHTFWLGAVTHIGDDGADVVSALDALEDREVVRRAPTTTVGDEIEYGFQHAMIRDVAYDRLPKAVRAAFHERCGDWIARVTGEDDDYIEFVAYHLEQACRLAREVGTSAGSPPVLRAAGALRRAGQKAANREGLAEADRFFARALDLLGEAFPETVLEITHERAGTLWQLGELEDALALTRRTAEEAARLGRDDLRGRALLDLATTSRARGQISDARAWLREAEAIPAVTTIPEQRALMAMVHGMMRANHEGDTAGAIESLSEAIEIADREGLVGLRVQARMTLGTILLNSGEMGAAEGLLTEAFDAASSLGSVRDQAIASIFLASVHLYLGPRDRASELADRAVAWLDRLSGHAYYLGQAEQTLGQLAMLDGDLTKAEDHLRRALGIAERLGGRVAAEIARHLVEVLCRQGWVAESRETASAARAAAPPKEPVANAFCTLAEAFAATAEGDAAGARHLFSDALLILEELRMALELASGRVSCAWAFGKLGLDGEALGQLRLARTAAASMGARALLDDIEAQERALQRL